MILFPLNEEHSTLFLEFDRMFCLKFMGSSHDMPRFVRSRGPRRAGLVRDHGHLGPEGRHGSHRGLSVHYEGGGGGVSFWFVFDNGQLRVATIASITGGWRGRLVLVCWTTES